MSVADKEPIEMSDNLDAEKPPIEDGDDLSGISVSTNPYIGYAFKPQVLDNGRTLLLGLTNTNSQQEDLRLHPSVVPFIDKQPTLSVNQIAAILDAPIEEEIDAAIVYKLKCSKCEVNGKIDSFVETFVCPECGGTMYLIEVYANHKQHSPEEIMRQLCVVYSMYRRGDLRAQKTWRLLISRSHSDRVLADYMQQYMKIDSVDENNSNSSLKSPVTLSSKSDTQTRSESCNNSGDSKRINDREPSPFFTHVNPSVFANRPFQLRSPQLSNASHTETHPNQKTHLMIPELEQLYRSVNESFSTRSYFQSSNQNLLYYLGYKVGKSRALNTLDRRKILLKAFVADTRKINERWNAPMTQERVNALISFLDGLNMSNRNAFNDYTVAINHRNEDIEWMSDYSRFVKDAISMVRNKML